MLYNVSRFSLPPIKTDRLHVTEKLLSMAKNDKQTKRTIHWIVAKTKKYVSRFTIHRIVAKTKKHVSYMHVVLIRQEAAKKNKDVLIEMKTKHPRQNDVVFG
jgi:hypothetical protein